MNYTKNTAQTIQNIVKGKVIPITGPLWPRGWVEL